MSTLETSSSVSEESFEYLFPEKVYGRLAYPMACRVYKMEYARLKSKGLSATEIAKAIQAEKGCEVFMPPKRKEDRRSVARKKFIQISELRDSGLTWKEIEHELKQQGGEWASAGSLQAGYARERNRLKQVQREREARAELIELSKHPQIKLQPEEESIGEFAERLNNSSAQPPIQIAGNPTKNPKLINLINLEPPSFSFSKTPTIPANKKNHNLTDL